VDDDGTFRILHDWFCEALDMDPRKRFVDARTALEAYNKATVEHPTPDEVLTGLDGFRSAIRSQLSLLSNYPMLGPPLRESDSIDAWRSTHDGKPVVVKMWKQAAWGDLKREGPRILAFLERARQIASDGPSGVPLVRAVLWLGDAIAPVQDWAEGSTLNTFIGESPERPTLPATPLTIVLALVQVIDRLHETGLGHGDLKPDNIIIGGDGRVSLIDILDFSPLSDGDKQNSAYAPPAGNRFERDRFAITKIADQLLALADLAPEHGAKLANAITTCRDKEPRLTTLLPLEEAIVQVQKALEPPAAGLPEHIVLSLSIRGASTGALESDEGYFYLRLYGASARGPATLHIRGAAEEIEVRLDDEGNPRSAWRRELSQTRISMVARHEFHHLKADIAIAHSDHTNLDNLEMLFAQPIVRAKIDAAFGAVPAPPAPISDELRDAGLDDDGAQESLVEEIAATPIPSEVVPRIDVPLLWRTLIDTEKDLTNEGVAEADSVFDNATRRHRVSIDLQSGSFDFDRYDTVGVRRQDRRGGWRRIGELDIRRSRTSAVMIDATDYGAATRMLRHFYRGSIPVVKGIHKTVFLARDTMTLQQTGRV
jgi:hypothetical protein